MKFVAAIGLEVHAQLLTESKIFCGCSTRYGAPPNSQTCPICLGMPGVLPVLNRKAVEFAIKMGVATHCRIASFSQFARKNYYYPDLPKGYQISQYDFPLCQYGWVDVNTGEGIRRIGIRRIHLEEDAGKSIHDPAVAGEDTLIDLNRCGIPLIEIVSEPVIRTPQEAYAYLIALKQILTYLEICDGNMEEGSLRCDANVSVRPVGQKELGVKTEVKNMNSFRNVERALSYEIERQVELLKQGGEILPETLMWDADSGEAKTMRSKEEEMDYRYFPEPDLVPITISQEWVEQVRESLPELPAERNARFIRQYGLPPYDAGILTLTRPLADYYEQVTTICQDYKLASNWVMSDILRVIKERGVAIEDFPITPQLLGSLLNLISDRTISQSAAKIVFEEMIRNPRPPEEIVEEKGLSQISDESALEPVVEKVLAENAKLVLQYRDGKTKVISYLMGQVMKATRGKADPAIVNRLLRDQLNK